MASNSEDLRTRLHRQNKIKWDMHVCLKQSDTLCVGSVKAFEGVEKLNQVVFPLIVNTTCRSSRGTGICTKSRRKRNSGKVRWKRLTPRGIQRVGGDLESPSVILCRLNVAEILQQIWLHCGSVLYV